MRRKIAIGVSAGIGLVLVGTSLVMVLFPGKLEEKIIELLPAKKAITNKVYSAADLAAGTGVDGRPCLVAVDGTVYLISGFALWADGKHLSSNGKAYCGADMTQAILESPHGKSKLKLLEIVGSYQG